MEIEYLIWATFWGLISMVMADNRGRDKYLGLASGLVFGVLTVIYYWIAGESKK